MTLFDYVVIAVLVLSVGISIVRGFTREVLALAAWGVAFFAANALSSAAAEWLVFSGLEESLRTLAAFAAVFVLTLVVASLFAMAVSRLLRSAGLGLEDRLLGGFFGLARGMLIVMVMVLLAGLTALPRQPVWSEAMLSPPLEALAGVVKPWLAQAVSRYISYD